MTRSSSGTPITICPPLPPATADSDRDALLQFHRHWYGEDQLTRSVANGM